MEISLSSMTKDLKNSNAEWINVEKTIEYNV